MPGLQEELVATGPPGVAHPVVDDEQPRGVARPAPLVGADDDGPGAVRHLDPGVVHRPHPVGGRSAAGDLGIDGARVPGCVEPVEGLEEDGGARPSAARGRGVRRLLAQGRQAGQLADPAEHPLGVPAVAEAVVCRGEPCAVLPGLTGGGSRTGDGVDPGQDLRPRALDVAAADLVVRAVQPPCARVLLDVGGEEDDRAAGDGEVHQGRGVVGDEDVAGPQDRDDLGLEDGVEETHVLRDARVLPHPEPMRPDDEHRAGAVAPVLDGGPVLGRRDAGVGPAVAPRGGVQDDPTAPQRPGRRLEPGQRALAAGVVVTDEQDVGTRLPGDRDGVRRQPEGPCQVARDGLGPCRQQRDPARAPAVHRGHEAPRGGPATDHRQTQSGRAVEVQPLERTAVPELDDDGAGGAIPVDVAEPVGDDDHPGAHRLPQAPGRALAPGGEPGGAGGPHLLGGGGEPDQPDGGVPLEGPSGHRQASVGDAEAAADDPAPGGPRHDRAEGVAHGIQRKGEHLCRVAADEGEGGTGRHTAQPRPSSGRPMAR